MNAFGKIQHRLLAHCRVGKVIERYFSADQRAGEEIAHGKFSFEAGPGNLEEQAVVGVFG